MATLLEIDRVQYLCTCQTWFPLSRLYFCRHCSLLRCRECVTHEIDSIFCPNCLENMPTAEARVKKNRCGNCFDCPCCNNTLAIRGTSLLPQGAIRVDEPSAEATGGGLAPKKAYYLACNFCRWTSRDSGIGDQTTATAGWPERVNSDEKILAAIQDQFRQMAAVEKSERERKKFTKRRSHFGMFYSDKYGLQALMARRRLGFGATDKNQVAEEPCMEPSEDLPLLPDQIFASELTLDEVTTIEQRHKQVLGQPEDTKELLPIRKRLVVRRSLRCKQCDHNLCKGEYNPSSIKFKIQLFAILHVPEVRILHIPKLIAGKLCEIHLTLANLSQSLTHVVLLPDVEMEEDFTFAKVDIPVTEMVLPVRDEAAELDDSGDQGNIFKDDPRIAPRAAAHVRARSVSSHLTLLDDGLYKHLKGNNMELVRLVKFLQSSMQDEQQRFSELRQRIATAEQSGENADQLKEELCLSQSRLAQLCSKNMKCFKKQGSSFSGNNDGGALEGSGKAGKQTTRKSLSTLHREKKRKENTNETEDNSGSTEVKQVEPNEDPLRSAFQAVLRDILGQNYQLGPSDQLENREIMYSSSTNFPRQEESRSKLFDELRTSVPRIPPTAVSEDSNLSRSPDRESPTPAIMGQSISHMTILDKSQDL